MLKTSNIKVRSNFSSNYYDSFKVDTVRGIVYFHQCDARRNGQVARRMTVTVQNNGTALIEALSANGGRYERFSHTQCLKLALRLLEEARSEAHQVSAVASAHAKANKGCKVFDMAVIVTLVSLAVFCTLMGVVELIDGAGCVAIAPIFGVAILSAYLGGNALLKVLTNSKE